MFIQVENNCLKAYAATPFAGFTAEVDGDFCARYDNGYQIVKGMVVYTPSVDETAVRVRHERDAALKLSDIQMLADNWARLSEVEQTAWTAYRTYLRDLPKSSDFPNIKVKTFNEWKGLVPHS